jgi:DNA primase
MYPRDLIDGLLKASDIVSVISSYIPVQKSGRNFIALCPFHDDKHPSLNISKEKQIFKCFSCGAGGNAITFIERYEKISFEEAVRKLATLVGYSDPRLAERRPVYKNPSLEPLYKCIDDLEKYYQYGLTIEEGKAASDYLAKRNIGPDLIAKYGIGYAPLDGKKTVSYLEAKGHSLKSIEGIGIALAKAVGTSDMNAGRLIFPLKNPDGQVIGFSARRIGDGDGPKYVNSPETKIFEKGKNLYNYENARRTARHDGYVYVLEGFMDVMALDRAGIGSAVALMGTNLTQEQITLLRRLNCEIRLCLDGDAAGQEGMMRCVSMLAKSSIEFRLVSNPGDLRDPDDILQAEGAEALKKWMNNLVDPFDFQLSYYQNVKKLETMEDKRKVFAYFLPFIRSVPAGIEREDYISKLSAVTGFRPDTIRRAVDRAASEPMTLEEASYADQVDFELMHPEKKYMKRLFMAERMTLYYMLENKGAIDYFQQHIDYFYNETYNRIANYIVDYEDKRGMPVDISILIADISNSEDPEADALEGKLSEIASAEYPPYSDEEIRKCGSTIAAERRAVSTRDRVEKELEKTAPSDDEEALRLAASYAEEKAKIQRQRWRRKRKEEDE